MPARPGKIASAPSSWARIPIGEALLLLPGAATPLAHDEVHLWTVPLDAWGDPAVLLTTLDGEERARAGRLRLPLLRSRFVAAHAALRIVLGRYLCLPPAEVAIVRLALGKPVLRAAGGEMRGGRADGGTGFDEADLHFSLAHAEDHAAIAVTRGRPLGVDIERIRPIEDAQQIAARYFAPEEAAELASLEESERGAAFFACWTRKEAYLKATGAGLSSSMAGFGVSLRPDAPPRLLHIAGDEAAAAAWTLHAMRLIPGFAAALAYPGAPRRLCLCGEPG